MYSLRVHKERTGQPAQSASASRSGEIYVTEHRPGYDCYQHIWLVRSHAGPHEQ